MGDTGLHFSPKGPCTHVAYTLALKYLYRDDLKANVSTYGYMDP